MAKAVLWTVASASVPVLIIYSYDWQNTDIANSYTEQVVLVFWWMNGELSVHKEFVALYWTETLQALSLIQIIEDVMLYGLI